MATRPNIATMNVSLPERLKRFVDGRVTAGFYGSASEFVREAIREKLLREQEHAQARGVLTTKLLEGLDSGAAVEFTDEYIGRKKRSLAARMSGGKRSA